jgi:GT2 family glycosyltransferase
MLPAIIPSYRNPHQLEKCLAALKSQTIPVEPWVYDNNIINAGYTRAINRGLRRAIKQNLPYAIILNQDCYLRPDAAQRMIAHFQSHPRCAIAGIKQLSSQDEDEIIHGGCLEAFPVGRHLTGRVTLGDCALSAKMPWVNGACLIARLDAVLDFGLMDENMFLIGSDSDWCYSARLRRWEVWYIADAVAIHESGVSDTPSPESLSIGQKDTAYWRGKWTGSEAFKYLAANV